MISKFLQAKPIEVINSRNDNVANDKFNISSFLNNVLPADRAPNMSGIPGLGLDATDNVSPSADYRSHQNQNSQMSHSTPLSMRNLDAHSPYSNHNSQSNVAFENASVTPLPPPPLPPPIFLDDDNCYNKLPPKFPTWAPTNDMTAEPAKWSDKSIIEIN